MPNFLLKGEGIKDILNSLAANTPAAVELKSQLGAANPTTPTVPDYTPTQVKAMVMNLLNNDPDVIAKIKELAL